ncbi:uncharacterized protein LOC106355352 [Brassica napus]|uniref:uncharacterized protein LOC106355352 n=1 Tax=Brassica napus TaxID=3708 RepID=UPI0006AB3CE7|nr:uncharacterized protein LOC106355352 [Brassica napus]
MGISINATVEECRNHRRRHHRVPMLNRIELEIEKFKGTWTQADDVSIWKNGKGKFKRSFSTKETWINIRENHILCDWYKAVWFKHATPKYAFVTWIAMRGRLATGERMKCWNTNGDVSCIFCNEPLETLTHLFFECSYSSQVWEALMKGVMNNPYTDRWGRITRLKTDSSWGKVKLFTVRYALQLTVHTLWRERNKRRHGESAVTAPVLIKRLDKAMRNQFTVIRRRGDRDYEDAIGRLLASVAVKFVVFLELLRRNLLPPSSSTVAFVFFTLLRHLSDPPPPSSVSIFSGNTAFSISLSPW